MQMCLSLSPPPPVIFLPPYFHENMHDFAPPRFFKDAGCIHAAVEWTPLLMA